MGTENKSFVVSESKLEETFILAKLYIPLCLCWLVEWIPSLVCISYIGNLPDANVLLSSLGLSKTLFTILWVALYGITTSLLTLLPQAIGADKYELLPLYFQRCFYLVLISSIPLVIILYFGGDILKSVRGSEDVDYNSVSQDCKYFIITLYAYIFLCVLQRVPQAINLNIQLCACTIISLLFIYPSCYFFITYLDLGSSGYALNSAALLIITIVLTIFVYYKNNLFYVFKPVSLNQVFDSDGIKEFLVLAIPGTVLNVLEVMSFEFATIYCSLITSSADIAIASAAIIVVIMKINVIASTSMCTALSLRISKYVGANMIDKAEECIFCGKLLSFIVSCVAFVILMGARKQIPMMYTIDEEIRQLTATVLYVTAISIIFFMGAYARAGIFRGIGKPQYPAFILLASYYMIPLPLMFVCLFVFDLRSNLLYGTLCIFITVGVGNCIAVIVMEVYLWFQLDWVAVVSDARQRLSETDRIQYERIKNNDNI